MFRSFLRFAAVMVLVSVTLVSAAASSAPLTIEFFHMTFLPEAQAIIDEAVRGFEAQNPEVRVKQTVVAWKDAYSKFTTALVGGAAPDIVTLPTDWALEAYVSGALRPVSQFVPQSLLQTFWDASLKSASFDNVVYGLPWESAQTGIFWRKDFFQAAGLNPDKAPANWDELVAYGKKLTAPAPSPQRWGLGFQASTVGAFPDVYWLPFMHQSGTTIVVRKDGHWQSDLLSPASIRGFNFYWGLVNRERITPVAVVGMIWEDVLNRFIGGEFGMMLNSQFAPKLLRQRAPQSEGKWGTAVLPAGPDGQRAVISNPNSLYITTQSRHPEVAAKFLTWFFSGEPSYAVRWAVAMGVTGLQKQFLNTEPAKDPLLRPFIESVQYGISQPPVPGYSEFRQTILNPALQDLLRNVRGPRETAEYLHRELTKYLSSSK